MDTAYSTSSGLDAGSATALAGTMMIVSLIGLALLVVVLIGMWKIFTKAGEAGWKCLIPIYSTIILLKIVGRPWWWLLLFFIPVVGFVVMIIVYNDLSKSFGHGMGFTLGLIFLNVIFFLILGFGSSRYLGPGGQPAYAGAGAVGGGYAPPPSYPPPAPQAEPPAAYPPAAPPAAPPYEPPSPPQV